MFFLRATRRMRASTVIRTLRTSTGTGFSTPSWLSSRVRSRRSVIRCESLSVSFLSCAAKSRAWTGSSSMVSSRLSARSLRLVAGVFSSWETFATKSRRILLTRFSSTTLMEPDLPGSPSVEPFPPEPFSTCRSGISLLALARLHYLPLYDGRNLVLSDSLEPRLEAVAQAPDRPNIVVVARRQRGPDAPDVHVYGARRAYARMPPHLFGELLPALELAGLRGQGHQELELFEPQGKRLTLHAGGEVLRVE